MKRPVIKRPANTVPPRPGRVRFPHRGGTLPFRAAARPMPPFWWRWGWLALLVMSLVMFAQTFQYLIDVYPLYMLSKIWPILTLPLFFWGLLRLDMPYKPLLVVTIGWVLGVAPVMSVLQLGNSLQDAWATTVKAWCFTFPLSAAAALVLMQPSPLLLRRVLMALGVALFLGLVIVWITIPFSVYDTATETKLFMYDDERGYHLFMPIFFGLMLMFALNRSFWMAPAVWKAAGIAVGFVIMFVIYKERATIAGAILTMVLGAALSLRGKLRPAAFAVMSVGGCVLMLLILQRLQSTALDQSLGGSLSIRKNSVATAMTFLGDHPLRWIFGVGATSRVGEVNLADILHNQSFFLADIGWLGIVFEYGLIGSTLIFLVHLAALRIAMQTARANDPVALAVGDYILYVLLVSPIYSALFTPGEVMISMALAWYMSRSKPTPGFP